MHMHPSHDDCAPDARRWTLPLAEHPRLELEADFANLILCALGPGEAPRLELQGAAPLPNVIVHGEGGTTKVSIGGWLGERWPSQGGRGRFWDGPFWDKRRWKRKFHTRLVAYVPRDVQARVRSSAAQVHASGLAGCDLRIELDAGALSFTDVSGRLSLSTEAGRIDGHGVGGTLDIATTAGAVHLDVTHLDPGQHRVRTNMGAAHIALARGLPVQIETHTSLGSSRIDHPSTAGAPSVLYVAADLGAIRIASSSRTWTPASAPAAGSPYRTADVAPAAVPARPAKGDGEIERILERVADGTLSPTQAREMLDALGWV